MLKVDTTITAALWCGLDTETFDYQIDGTACGVTVERSDEDEIRISAATEIGGSEDAGIYLSTLDALQLAALLCAAAAKDWDA